MSDDVTVASPVEILLVDDRPENLLALEVVLEPLGHTLIRATSGEDALRQLLRHDVAVILLDVQMPGMGGLEVAKIVKSRERSRHIPTIFLTANVKEQEFVAAGYSVGAVDYLLKPFQPEILRSKVAVLVDLYLKQRKVAEQERQLHVAETQDMKIRHMQQLLESETKFRDQLKATNEELSARQSDLKRAMSSRSRFYASMSHELRTPLNALLGYTALLLERIYGPLNNQQADAVERTQRAARHLLELVNDVLDLSKLEAGKTELRMQPVVMPALIDDLFVTVRPLADAHGSSLTVKADHDLCDVSVVTDPRRVRQILLNLLSNAIKFGAGRPIDVACVNLPDGGVAIEVTDYGPGIPTRDQEQIFHEFVQLGEPKVQEGTGLGLPISRRLAELLHGTLTVRSTVGEGSTFRLSLPGNLERGRHGSVAARDTDAGRPTHSAPGELEHAAP